VLTDYGLMDHMTFIVGDDIRIAKSLGRYPAGAAEVRLVRLIWER
jgi:hypothetical protein